MDRNIIRMYMHIFLKNSLELVKKYNTYNSCVFRFRQLYEVIFICLFIKILILNILQLTFGTWDQSSSAMESFLRKLNVR